MNELNFDKFVSRIHKVFDTLPDNILPSPNRQYSIKDAALGAFAMFFSQAPSFLSYQQSMQQTQGRNNAQSFFGIENIPSDNQIRNLLDPIAAILNLTLCIMTNLIAFSPEINFWAERTKAG